MTCVCTFVFTVTVMEMKHTQEHLFDTSSPPVVHREGSGGGCSGHGGVLPRACMLPGLKSMLHMWLCMYHVCMLFVSGGMDSRTH
jgi:hypothetical protein